MGFDDFVGLVASDRAAGSARVTMTASERHLDGGGAVHGGAIATLIDVSMSRAVASLFATGEHPVTIEMKVNYLRRGGLGDLVAQARVGRRDGRLAVVHADVTQCATHEIVAEAMGTFTST
jgi:uncharacterized protein (TIGR00369 family)